MMNARTLGAQVGVGYPSLGLNHGCVQQVDSSIPFALRLRVRSSGVEQRCSFHVLVECTLERRHTDPLAGATYVDITATGRTGQACDMILVAPLAVACFRNGGNTETCASGIPVAARIT